jgi:intracellular septation protein
MKLLEFIPVILFFIVYKMPEKAIQFISPILSDDWVVTLQNTKAFVLATSVIIVATLVQILITWFATRKVEKMTLVVLAVILVLGVPSIILNDPMVFMWKPTVANWLFAAAFALSYVIGQKKPLIQRMLGGQVILPEPIWRRLNAAWILFFIVSGTLNLLVAYNFSEATWVDFKLYGILGLTLLFGILQGVYLARHIQEPAEEQQKL